MGNQNRGSGVRAECNHRTPQKCECDCPRCLLSRFQHLSLSPDPASELVLDL